MNLESVLTIFLSIMTWAIAGVALFMTLNQPNEKSTKKYHIKMIFISILCGPFSMLIMCVIYIAKLPKLIQSWIEK